MAKRGRQTTYTPEKGDKLCELIAEGMSASKACKKVGVPMRTFYEWNREHKDFSAQLTCARQDQADTFADQMCDIADDEGDVQRAKLKIDARKWVAARMKPKSWGDKQAVEHTGKDGGPIQTTTGLTDEQLERIAAGRG